MVESKRHILVVGESWCPFTQEAWNIEKDGKIDIEKVDCGTCSRLEDTEYTEGTITTTTKAKDCRDACDMALGYPAYLIKSADGHKINNCPQGYGFNNENATMDRLRHCVRHFFPPSQNAV